MDLDCVVRPEVVAVVEVVDLDCVVWPEPEPEPEPVPPAASIGAPEAIKRIAPVDKDRNLLMGISWEVGAVSKRDCPGDVALFDKFKSYEPLFRFGGRLPRPTFVPTRSFAGRPGMGSQSRPI